MIAGVIVQVAYLVVFGTAAVRADGARLVVLWLPLAIP